MHKDPRNSLPLSIETKRLILRAPMRGDVLAMVENANNRRVADMLARLPHPYTRADGIGFVEILAQRPDHRPYVIIRKREPGTATADRNGVGERPDGLFLGVVSFVFNPGEAPELGYWLGEKHWGKGYATEAASALVAAARATGVFPAIRATAKVVNRASRNVLEKVGLRRVGRIAGRVGKDSGQPVDVFEMALVPA